MADQGYDAAERVLHRLRQAGKTAVIPPQANRKQLRPDDRERDKRRPRIENFFCQLKPFRALATRYDKTAPNFRAAIHLAAAIIGLNGGQALARISH
jgi:transposase